MKRTRNKYILVRIGKGQLIVNTDTNKALYLEEMAKMLNQHTEMCETLKEVLPLLENGNVGFGHTPHDQMIDKFESILKETES